MRRLALCASILALALAACGREELPDASSDAYRESVSSFYQALAAVQAGEDVGGRTGFERVTELVPGEPSAWANLGILALRRNNFEEATEFLGKAHELAPDHAHLEMLLGLLAAARGDFAGAASHYDQAYDLDPSNVKAAYALAQELERQATPETEARALTLLGELSAAHPQNVALAVEAARLALKREDQAALAGPVERLERASRTWDDSEAREQLAGLQESANGRDFRHASTRLTFLRNLLLRVPSFRQDLAAIQTPVEQPGDFVTSFIRLPQPPPATAAADSTVRFVARPIDAGGAVAHAGVFYATGESSASVWYLVGNSLVVDSLRLPFPGDASTLPAHAQPVAAIDFDYDYNTDLILAGQNGIRILRGDGRGGFADATAAAKLPATHARGVYASVWPLDFDLEGDL
ncbi:MAG TPA: tetratricopeptide repeat protein, partial [Rhodothermales bacterium]